MKRLPDVISKQIQELDLITKSLKEKIDENKDHPHTKIPKLWNLY